MELTMEYIRDQLQKKLLKLRVNAEKLGDGDLAKGKEQMKMNYSKPYNKLMDEIASFARMYLEDKCFYFGFGDEGMSEDMQEIRRILSDNKKRANTALFCHMDFEEYEEILEEIKNAVFLVWVENSKRITQKGGENDRAA